MFKKNDEMIRIKISDDDAAEVIAAVIKRRVKMFNDEHSLTSKVYVMLLMDFGAELLAVLGDRDEVRRILEERDDG